MKLKSLLVPLLSVTSITTAHAQLQATQTGQAITRGNIASVQDYSSLRTNPASVSHLLANSTDLNVNIFGPIGGGYEMGRVDSLLDELDELIDILDQDNLGAQEALDAKQRFDPFLENAAVDGRIKVFGYATIPLFPITWKIAEDHSVYADLQIGGSLRATVLDDNIDIIGFNDTFAINTDAAVYVKSLGMVSLGLGYAAKVWDFETASLHAGAKANINRFALSKNILSLAGLEDGEDIGDAIQDDYENNANTSVGVGIDLGVELVGEFYLLGFSISDINEPDYEYGSLRSDCQNLSGISLDNCLVAQNIIADGRIRADEVYTANAQARLSGSYTWGEDDGLVIAASIDLNDKNDPIGDAYQWAHLSATSYFENSFLPELRVGFSQNLSGSELSYYGVGLTLFKYADLDVAWSDEQVDIDGDSAPRSFFISFSVQSRF